VTRFPGCGWAEQCHIVPSPLVGEGQGEGWQRRTKRERKLRHNASQNEELLLPYLRFETSAVRVAVPLSLSLPHKGGGNDVACTFATHDRWNLS
jgi:hypothetical protein